MGKASVTSAPQAVSSVLHTTEAVPQARVEAPSASVSLGAVDRRRDHGAVHGAVRQGLVGRRGSLVLPALPGLTGCLLAHCRHGPSHPTPTP